MNRAAFSLDGLADEIEAMEKLPETLAAKSQPVVESTGARVAAEIRGGYPVRTGKLAAGVHVQPVPHDEVNAVVAVVNDHPLAGIFEHGTMARHTSIGANRGSMPAGNVFLPPIYRARRDMEAEIADVIEGEGLTVTTNA